MNIKTTVHLLLFTWWIHFYNNSVSTNNKINTNSTADPTPCLYMFRHVITFHPLINVYALSIEFEDKWGYTNSLNKTFQSSIW